MTTILVSNDTLANPEKRVDIYWDTCLFYEFFGGETANLTPQQRAGCRGVMREVEEGKVRIVTSLLTQLEVVPSKMESKRPDADRQFLAAFDSERMIAVEVSPNIIARAREIRDFYFVPAVPEERGEDGKITEHAKAARYMDLGDCVHIASATLYGITQLHTRDGWRTSPNKKKRSNVTLKEVAERSMGTICGKWSLKICQPEAIEATLFDDEGTSDD